MRLLAEGEGKNYSSTAWAGGRFALAGQTTDQPFACLIWDHGLKVSAEEQMALCQVLIDAGCRYAVCGGYQCEAWHDAADLAAVIRDSDEVDDPFVMTTWHEGEPPEEVAWFFLNLTDFEEVEFRDYLILHIGIGPEGEVLDAAVRNLALQRHGRI